MPANAYLTVAAGQLRQAITTLKQEASSLRSEAANERRQMQQQLTSMEAEKKVKTVQAYDPQHDSNFQAGMQLDARRLDGKISDINKDIDRRTNELEQQARSKESAATDLESQVSTLERLAADTRLR